jgi:hypothetical protein
MKFPRQPKWIRYLLAFAFFFAIVFGFGWLRSETRKGDYFRPNLSGDSLLEISILSALAAAYGVYRFSKKE